MKSDICVVHLVRRKNGPEPFQKFIESYKSHNAGIEHDLLIIFKGFQDPEEVTFFKSMLADLTYEFIHVKDKGFDLGSYFTAAKKRHYQYMCFINSFSRILHQNWLFYLFKAIKMDDIGIAGCSGSAASMVPPKYQSKKGIAIWKMILRPVLIPLMRVYRKMYFKEFPNFHVRTNAFIIKREIFLKLKTNKLLTKSCAYRLESGKLGISRQIEAMGFNLAIVAKSGTVFYKKDWSLSNIFWCGNQENLMISDNQTDDYQYGSILRKEFLRGRAWGS